MHIRKIGVDFLALLNAEKRKMAGAGTLFYEAELALSGARKG